MDYKKDFIQETINFYKSNLGLLRKFKLSNNDPSISHQHIISYASYSPWLDDDDFIVIYDQIKDHTLVDIYRCYELYSFIRRNNNLQGDVLEVGVWKGGTGCLLAHALNHTNPESSIYLADTFRGVVKAGINDTNYKGGEHSDTSIQAVESLIKHTGVKNVQILKGMFPDTVQIPSSTKLRLCHIDVDTYKSASDIFNSVWPQIVVGGAVIFDDYGFWGCEGVTKLCNELASKISTFIYNLNGHGVFIKN